MAKRLAGDWISTYLDYTDNTEPQVSFHTWTAISVIAAALQRRVWMQWGHLKIFPNLYIVLCGTSGRARKGTAMGLGKNILRQQKGVILAAESVTREALIRIMKGASSTFIDPYTNTPMLQCPVTVFSEELAVFLGQADLKFLSNLTDWYDSDEQWSYETKGGGKEQIDGVCVNILGATAPEWLQSILPQEAIGGGFTSRIIFIVEERKRKTVVNPTLGVRELELRKKLISDLEQIMLLNGHIEFTPEAETIYEHWYENEDSKIARGQPPISDIRFSGYNERRPTHIKKLGVIMSASRGNSMLVDADDFGRAQKLMEAAEVNMVKAFGGLGDSKYGQITDKLYSYIKIQKTVTRSALLSQFYRDVDPETLDIVFKTLEYMKVVKVSIAGDGSEVTYKYVGD